MMYVEELKVKYDFQAGNKLKEASEKGVHITLEEAIRLLIHYEFSDEYYLNGGSITAMGFNTPFQSGDIKCEYRDYNRLVMEHNATHNNVFDLNLEVMKKLHDDGKLSIKFFYSSNYWIDLHFTLLDTATNDTKPYISFCFCPAYRIAHKLKEYKEDRTILSSGKIQDMLSDIEHMKLSDTTNKHITLCYGTLLDMQNVQWTEQQKELYLLNTFDFETKKTVLISLYKLVFSIK